MIDYVGVIRRERQGQITLKKDRPVIKALLMISQIGISMIVPIFLGAFLGYQLDRWLGTGFFFLVFLFFGILAAFRNIYKLTKPFYAEDLKREQQQQAYWEDLRKARQQGLGEQDLEKTAEEEFISAGSICGERKERRLDGGSSHDSGEDGGSGQEREEP